MRRGGLWGLLAVTACTGMTVRPQVSERRGITRFEMYEAFFEVACDRCSVEYGRDGETFRDDVDGGWSRSVPLGTLGSGEQVLVVLRVRPAEGSRVLSARIASGGSTLASTEDKEPGESVDLSARVRAR